MAKDYIPLGAVADRGAAMLESAADDASGTGASR